MSNYGFKDNNFNNFIVKQMELIFVRQFIKSQ